MHTSLLAFVMTAMSYLAPGPDHFELASAIADEVGEAEPLFAHDEERRRTAALVVAVAFREGSLRVRVEGDCSESAPGELCKGRPRSFCTMQVHASSGGDASLNDDPRKCIRTGLAMLRASARVDRLNPVAFYARGPRFATEAAKRISRDRMALAERVRSVTTAVLDSIVVTP